MSFNQFIRPELMILIPVMYLAGIAIKKSPVRDYLIPFILGGASVFIATIYVLATALLAGWQDVLMAIFTGLTQGVLAAGASVYANQMLKQAVNGKVAGEFLQDFSMPDAEPMILVDLVKKGNKVRDGQIHTKNKIIVHESGNYKKDADALAHAKYLHNMAAANTTYISWHYTVDADRIVQHIPDNEIAWHAGDNMKENGGNMSGIGIEMCVNDMSRYDEVLQNTAWLIGRLMATHQWTIGNIKQHFDCSGKNCPLELRKKPGKWQDFISMCQAQYNKASAPISEQYNRVQVGAWANRAAAESYAAKLCKIKIDNELVKAITRHYDGFWRVQVGAWSYESFAKTFANKLQQHKIDGQPIKTVIKYY